MELIRNYLLNTKLFYFLIFITFGLIFLGHFFVAGQAVYGDGIEYYAWLHSAYFDKDINFKNELIHIYNHEYNNSFPDAVSHSKPALTPIGKVGNFHMPGMAILLFPFYVLADLIVLTLNLIGINALRNGYSDIYQISCGLGAVIYAILGILITENLFKNLFTNTKNKFNLFFKASVLSVVLASPLIYYLSIDVLNSHFATFFITSLYFYVLFLYKSCKTKFVLLGFLLGLATLMRLQEAALFATLILYLTYDLYFKKIYLKTMLLSFFMSLLFFLITISPLALAWSYLYGSVFSHPYLMGFANINSMNIFGSLFDQTNGLFTKTPFLLFLLIATPLTLKRKEFIILFFFFIIQVFAIAKYGGWPAASFGGRMYISSLPLFFLLANVLFLKINKKLSTLIILFFIILNFLNIFNFMIFDKQTSGEKRGLEIETKIKIEKILKFI